MNNFAVPICTSWSRRTRVELHLHAIDEDPVAAAEILDDEFEGVERQPRVMARDEVRIDHHRARDIAADDVFTVLDGVLGFEFLADVDKNLRLDLVRRCVRIVQLRVRHKRGQVAHSRSKSTSTIRAR
jgi:hypothetical protein